MPEPLPTTTSSKEPVTEVGELVPLTCEQVAFAEVVGREIARAWKESHGACLQASREESEKSSKSNREDGTVITV